MPLHRAVEPTFDRIALRLLPTGWIGERVRAGESGWLVPAPASNPGMVGMLAHRDDVTWVNGSAASLPRDDWRNPDPLPWAGEFAGKYLLAAVSSLRLTGSLELASVAADVVAGVVASQGADGSVGMPLAWDLWGQYHVMLGLIRWYELTADLDALTACRRAALLAVARYSGRAEAIALDHPGDDEKNQAIAHALVLLYEHTGEQAFLDLVRQIEGQWASANCRNVDPDGTATPVMCGNFIGNALNGLDFHAGTRPRWESLHDVQALAELFFVTGSEHYRAAFVQIWRNLRDLERHADGGFGGGEGTTGDPESPRYVETCATVAWSTLCVDMLRLTGDPAAADELERTLFNALRAAQSPDGRLWTYHTPVGGVPPGAVPPPTAYLGYRLPAVYDLDWQARDFYPQLSCCAANGPRGLAGLSEWAVMAAPGAIVVNYYGPGTATLTAPDGTPLTLIQRTDYPVDGGVTIDVRPDRPTTFVLRVRIPQWSTSARVLVNDDPVVCSPGTYCDLERTWVVGDVVSIVLDMGIRAVPGVREAAGRVSLFRGPLLLSYDGQDGAYDVLALPRVRVTDEPALTVADGTLRVSLPTEGGGTVTLVDFASAGQTPAGALPARPDPSVPWQFSRSNGDVLSPRLTLLAGGGIAGYAHPNEARWGFVGDDLAFYTQQGLPSTRFTMRWVRAGRQVLSGMSLLDGSIRHVLSEVVDDVVGRTWQFWRRQAGGETVLVSPLGLRADGTFDRPTHPNESRWRLDNGSLTFVDAGGSPTTRFGPPHMNCGRAEYVGSFLPDGSITHVLSEIDLVFADKVWRFWRVVAGATDTVIDDKVRLLPDGRLDGHSHPNESSWGRIGDDLAFFDAGGRVTTRFTSVRVRDGVMVFEGAFLPTAGITHRLEERGAGHPLGPGYVSWFDPA